VYAHKKKIYKKKKGEEGETFVLPRGGPERKEKGTLGDGQKVNEKKRSTQILKVTRGLATKGSGRTRKVSWQRWVRKTKRKKRNRRNPSSDGGEPRSVCGETEKKGRWRSPRTRKNASL